MSSPRTRELTPRPGGDPGLGRHARTCSSRSWRARWRSTRASWSTPTTTSVGCIDSLEELGVLDDTLVILIIGDNGASAEGTVNGTFNELLMLNGASALETPEFMAARVDLFGTPEAYNHYAVGWAHAMDAPYQWTKQVASHWGGTRNGTIVHWPNGIKAKGEIRHQFHHVIDVAPTVLEVAGLPEPTFVHGVQQVPYEGVEHALHVRRRGRSRAARDPVLRDVRQPRHLPQGLDRGHPPQHALGRSHPCRPSTTTSGSSTARTTGPSRTTSPQSSPSGSRELQRLFLIEAARHNVLPLDDRRVERFNSDLAGRPQLVTGNRQLLFRGMGRLSENSVIVLKNKSHAVTANVLVPEAGANGVIVAQGGAFGGWTLYALDGKPAYCYNLFGIRRFKIYGEEDDPGRRAPGADGVRVRRRRPGQGRHGHPVSSTVPRWARAASTATVPICSRATRPPTSAATPARR